MKCKVCDRPAVEDGFCLWHSEAYRNIKAKYETWRKASGLTWMAYLVEIQKNSLTGEWAKDVVKQLIKEEDGNVE